MKTKIKNITKKIGNQHDNFFKHSFSPLKSLTELCSIAMPSSEFKTYNWNTLKSEKDTFKPQATDLLFSVGLKGQAKIKTQIGILVEHKSYNDPKLYFQLFRYQLLILEKSITEKKSPVLVIFIVFYHGRNRWQGGQSFQQAFLGPAYEKISRLSRQSMVDFQIKLVDVQDPRVRRIFKNKKFNCRGALMALDQSGKNQWSKQKLEQVLRLYAGSDQDTMVSLAEYTTVTGKVTRRLWDEVEDQLVAKGLLHKGGYMNIREQIKHRGMLEGWQKGQQAERKQVIANMLKEKMGFATISKVTGLTVTEIKKLSNGADTSTK